LKKIIGRGKVSERYLFDKIKKKKKYYKINRKDETKSVLR